MPHILFNITSGWSASDALIFGKNLPGMNPMRTRGDEKHTRCHTAHLIHSGCFFNPRWVLDTVCTLSVACNRLDLF